MSRRIEKDGKMFRLRRGVRVEIPAEWVGRVAFPQTQRKRAPDSKKRTGGLRRRSLQNRGIDGARQPDHHRTFRTSAYDRDGRGRAARAALLEQEEAGG